MNDTLKGALIGATAAVLAAIVAAWLGFRSLDASRQQVQSQFSAAEQERQKLAAELERLRKMQDGVPGAFGAKVTTLVDQTATAPAGEDAQARQSRVEGGARAIVKARNDLRAALDSVAQRLDPEMENLSRELGRPQPNTDRLATSAQALQRSWVTRKTEMEAAIKRLIAELGLGVAPS